MSDSSRENERATSRQGAFGSPEGASKSADDAPTSPDDAPTSPEGALTSPEGTPTSRGGASTWSGAALRSRRHASNSIDQLRQRRPRSKLLRVSVLVLAALAVYAWTCGDIQVDDLLTERRWLNLKRFLTEELPPHALLGKPFDVHALLAWMRELFVDKHGAEGALITLAISVLAISLAGLWALCLVPFAARNLATRRPFDSHTRFRVSDQRANRAWRALTTATRALLIFLRAIPEYVWAFLLLAMLGPGAWPAVLALAIHNAGILGKLGAETVENLEPRAPRALRELGATRAEIAIAAVLPLSLARFLLYFFYRFETCVREATVLGMLGIVSLGYWIQDARAKHFYDEMAFFVALGALIVLVGDLVSAAARRAVRRST